ncbi:MAG: phosphoethanolamine--lipid A transferase [Rhodocyclaceae bacterium]|jgi:lipid A ethanolaminephosphotransferase|nr:phosphoethanolamine--lipid A transferase [Rhodocyclaceae bacterium]MBK6554409.1 phosphoethanolamine--lipid A transferase [Rhodocyclaceae bacterium]MBK6677634.1 phosphoethanolamine--lipid A transferase [Rhodocyclaceae bacterium]MBK7813013.1 phosphoethanolamine--lipid A transferase [Rhodocyclaceae bacterium]MBK9310310.1 phosphoethanolamine--lipid A transferase [Rhodocyclaceae bacterium]
MGEANVLLSSGFNAAATDDVIWRQPGGKAESRSASSWLRWRPEVSAENLLLACSLYFVLVACRPFWHALLAHRAGDAISLAYVLAVGIGLTGVHFLLFAPLLARWTIKPLLASLIVVSASASYFAGQFGVYFDPDMLRNVVRTDIPEARELLGPSLFAHVLAIALPALVVLQRVRVRRRAFARALGLRLVYILIVAIVAAGALGGVYKDFSAQMRNHKEIRYLIVPAAPLWSLVRVMTNDARAANVPRRPIGTDARLGASWPSAKKPALFVIVVGETARADNWGLNRAAGHSPVHDTTPELARRDVINFPDMKSCGTDTEVSVPCMFSLQGRKNYDEDAIRTSESLLDVLNHAGLHVIWNDNQSGCKGVCDGVDSMRPDPAAFPDLCGTDRCLDGALLESSEKVMRDTKGNLVLVLHQLGNHGPAYSRRYPDAFRRFMPTCDEEDLSRCSREQVINSYDNALLYTDHVLGGTIDWLKRLESTYDTAMIYVSDHGESLGEKGLYLHGLPYSIAPDEQTRVPMTLWLSTGFVKRNRLNPDCLRARANQPASHDNLFHTVLGLLDVTTALRDDALDLTTSCRGG